MRSTVLIGPDGTVEKIWSKAKSKGHAAEVVGSPEIAAIKSSIDFSLWGFVSEPGLPALAEINAPAKI